MRGEKNPTSVRPPASIAQPSRNRSGYFQLSNDGRARRSIRRRAKVKRGEPLCDRINSSTHL